MLRELLAGWLERCLPRPQLREGATGCPRRSVKRVVVFGRLPNPTFDYYLAARLEAPGMPPFKVVDIRGQETSTLEADGVFVIICRYASPLVLQWIEHNASRLSGVGLFVDDDIPAVVTGKDADFRYRLFLWYRALWPLRRLNRHLDIVWASTPHLASRLAGTRPVVLPPAPPSALWSNGDSDAEALSRVNGQILIGYHATGVHLQEHRFLRPIIEEVLRKRPHTQFEVFADRRARTIWQGLDRVQIREPLPWMDYLADAKDRRIDVMLVPLAPSHVNDSRASTKRIDIARYKAAALFSEAPAYSSACENSELRLPYRAETWCRAILQLVDDASVRRKSMVATRQTVLQMTSAADTGLEVFKERQMRQ